TSFSRDWSSDVCSSDLARLQKVDYSNGLYIGGVCDVYSVATFYPEFRFKKPPKVEVKVCTALPCFLKGAEIEYQKIAKMADASRSEERRVGKEGRTRGA